MTEENLQVQCDRL